MAPTLPEPSAAPPAAPATTPAERELDMAGLDPAMEELELQLVEAEVPVAEVTVVEKPYAELQLEE